VRDVSPPWSTALAGQLERDRRRLLVAFIELRGWLLQTTGDDFAGGEAERAEALARTEHDYLALVEVGAEAARLQAELKASDREATVREFDTAALLLTQMNELADAVRGRVPEATSLPTAFVARSTENGRASQRLGKIEYLCKKRTICG